MKCANCGKDMPDEARFCGECGTEVDNVTTSDTEVGIEKQNNVESEPEVVEAETVEAEAIEPEAVEPEVVEVEAVEPEVVAVEAIEPEVVEPVVIEPEAVEPEVVDSEVVESEAVESVVAEVVSEVIVDDVKTEQPPKSKKGLIGVGIAVAVLGLFLIIRLFAGGSAKDVPTTIVYLKDNAIMMVDLAKKNAKPVELTDSFEEEESRYSIFWRNDFSEDGKFVYYIEDYDGVEYDLYRAEVAKPDKKEKISSKVTSHLCLDNNTLLYVKNDTYYYLNGKDTLKFGKDVSYARYFDEDEKNFCWSEMKNGKRTYYLQDLAQKNDKVKLLADVDEFYCNDTLTKFYALSGDTVYELDNTGEKEKIAKKVDRLISVDRETGTMYYGRNNNRTIPYEDIIVDDTKMSIWEKNLIKNEVLEWEGMDLFFYDGEEEHLLAEEVASENILWYGSGKHLLIRQMPPIDTLKIKWSEIMGEGASEVIEDWQNGTGITLFTQAEEIGSYSDIEYAARYHDKDRDTLYIYSEDDVEESGAIYKILLTGDNAGELNEFDTDAYGASFCYATEDGLFYLKDTYTDGGDLYLNDELIASDVYQVASVSDKGLFMFATDYDSDDEYYDISLKDGKKITTIASEVYEVDCAEDGTMLLLVDYDVDDNEGDLMYYDGKELRKIDDEVAEFGLRRGSSTIY